MHTSVAGVHTFSIYLREDGLLIDTIAIARQNGRRRSTTPGLPEQPADGAAADWSCRSIRYRWKCWKRRPGILATGSLAACFANQTSGPAFDMSGNVKEWTLARDTDQNWSERRAS
jgi:hypothetical protein